MIGDPDNLEKMKAIYLAMKNVNEIDRSDYFNNYFKEVIGRIARTARFEMKIKYDENQSLEEEQDLVEEFLKKK